MNAQLFEIRDLLKDVEEVERLNRETPEGMMIDSDVILTHILEDVDYPRGFVDSKALLELYKETDDKNTFKEFFAIVFNESFEDYLDKCKKDITKSDGSNRKGILI